MARTSRALGEKKIGRTANRVRIELTMEGRMTMPDLESRPKRREILARWKFLALATVSLAPLSAAMPHGANFLSAAQAAHTGEKRPGLPAPPPPADPDAQDTDAAKGIDPQTAKRVMAAKNEKEFREGVEK